MAVSPRAAIVMPMRVCLSYFDSLLWLLQDFSNRYILRDQYLVLTSANDRWRQTFAAPLIQIAIVLTMRHYWDLLSVTPSFDPIISTADG